MGETLQKDENQINMIMECPKHGQGQSLSGRCPSCPTIQGDIVAGYKEYEPEKDIYGPATNVSKAYVRSLEGVLHNISNKNADDFLGLDSPDSCRKFDRWRDELLNYMGLTPPKKL